MEKMNNAKQTVFDMALNHIRQQGRASFGDRSSSSFIDPKLDGIKTCKYHDGKGNGCAFAPMIAQYDESMEGIIAYDLIKLYADKLYPSAIESGSEFCQSIQQCHDHAALSDQTDEEFMIGFERNMKSLAAHYELNYQPVKEFVNG